MAVAAWLGCLAWLAGWLPCCLPSKKYGKIRISLITIMAPGAQQCSAACLPARLPGAAA